MHYKLKNRSSIRILNIYLEYPYLRKEETTYITMSGWKAAGRSLVYYVFTPFVNFCIKFGISANMITVLGLLLNLLAAGFLVYAAELQTRDNYSLLGWAGFTILIAGLMDMVDGRLARVSQSDSNSGALFDSVIDRYSEMFMFLGICYYLISYDYFLSSLFAFIAMIGSVMVSYTRARAEGLGVDCSVGSMQRPERVMIVGFAAMFCGITSGFVGDVKVDVDWLPFPLFETMTVFTLPLAILAILANVTAFQRLNYGTKQLDQNVS